MRVFTYVQVIRKAIRKMQKYGKHLQRVREQVMWGRAFLAENMASEKDMRRTHA